MRRSAPDLIIRPLQYRDLEVVEQFCDDRSREAHLACSMVQPATISPSRWYGIFKFLSWFPNPQRNALSIYVAELNQKVQGMIRVSPFNRTCTTWRVDQVAVESALTSLQSDQSGAKSGANSESVHGATTVGAKTAATNAVTNAVTNTVVTSSELGTLLLRHCLETIWQARTWILELDVSDKPALALYRQNGFQPVAQMTYWSIAATQLAELADREPDLPNLMPVSNADASLLYQLDNMAMPPLVRQVFDRHPEDFKTSLLSSLIAWVKQWVSRTETVSGYVFEPQRQVAIGYFQLHLCRDGSVPHRAQLTVHPAYTWLYPELMAQMARVTQDLPAQALHLTSADYHPEREEYLERIGADRVAHTVMMSRSVWHKLRETKPATLEGLQLSDVLSGLQPAKPMSGRISMLKSSLNPDKKDPTVAPQAVPLTDRPAKPRHGDPSGC
jgi:hypothetical protein